MAEADLDVAAAVLLDPVLHLDPMVREVAREVYGAEAEGLTFDGVRC